jgi:tight adherence protein C
MPVTVIAGAVLLALFLPLVCWATVTGDGGRERQSKQNLLLGLSRAQGTPERAHRPVTAMLLALTTPGNRRMLEKTHALAGRPRAWPLERVLAAKPVLCLAVVVVGGLLLAGRPVGILGLLVVGTAAVAYFVPDLLLYSRGLERQTAIALELPDTLDQMLIAVEAGLGFEAAMTRAGENGKGPLAEELIRVLQDMRVGMSRKEAYVAMAARTSVPEVRSFVRAVVQADAYGISITQVLRTQAKEMRVKRRQRAEEQAMKIPVKVLFPLMLFILPVLFIAVLGPTVITVLTTT